MLLSARVLENVSSVNSFDYSTEVRFTEGDGCSVYLQLIDKSKDRAEQGFLFGGRRYAAAPGSLLMVSVNALDSARGFTRPAVLPFQGDSSIWKLEILPTDRIRGTIDLFLILTEGTKVTRGHVPSALVIDPKGNI